jgi:asparagine synthase (glutamine-hydrolysing)
MCGICGIAWKDTSLIRRMTKSLTHRGPDDKGTYTDKNIGLGHTRLSIIDLSKKGAQPMTYDNGKLCHYLQRRDLQLQGDSKKNARDTRLTTFTSNSDTEVLLAGYARMARETSAKTEWDVCLLLSTTRKKKTFFLARDRFGIKPLVLYNSHTKRKNRLRVGNQARLSAQHSKRLSNRQRSGVEQFFTFRFTLGETHDARRV